eukprot:Gb_39950 [translate_table: standard]
MSKPLAATSVATRIENFPERNPASVTSRCDCCISPCNARALPGKDPASSDAAFFVSVKTIVRPPLL